MRGIVYESGGVEALAITELPDPKPAAGEVLLRVKGCAMNHLDVWATKNPENRRFGGPRIMGSDVSGVVEELGLGVTGYSIGDQVVVSPGISCQHCFQCLRGRHADCPQYHLLGVGRDGGYSELMTVPAANLAPLPSNLSLEEAASVPLVFITAWRMLHERARVEPGEWVLVTAAGSGVGIAAIQIAKSTGAKVITTASTEEKRQKGLDLGADAAIDYTQPDWHQQLLEITGGRGVNVAADSVGGRTIEELIKGMAPGGRVVNCGFTDTTPMSIEMATLRDRKISVGWSFMGSNSYMHESLRLMEAGRMKPVVHKVFPFEEVQDAHHAMINRGNFGKIVLTWQ